MLSVTQTKKIQHAVDQSLVRKRMPISDRTHKHIVVSKKSLLNFGGNDYLGMAQHPIVKKAYIHGVNQFGVGSGSSALLSGFFEIQQQAEQKAAEFLGRERAIIFNSGYTANIGALSSLLDRHSTVVADKYCHASILDGIQLSRAKCVRYRHNDQQHFQQVVNAHKPDWVIAESVFSMQGSKNCIEKSNDMKLYLDDAHGAGVVQQSFENVNCLVTPLGKAFGCLGGVVSGDANLIEYILQFARSYRYTTALPPAMYAAIDCAFDIVQQDTWRTEKLQSLIAFFNVESEARGFKLVSNDLTAIRAIIIPDVDKALNVQETLQKTGFYVACVRPPTVPVGQARIRISLGCMHDEHDIIQLLDALRDVL